MPGAMRALRVAPAPGHFSRKYQHACQLISSAGSCIIEATSAANRVDKSLLDHTVVEEGHKRGLPPVIPTIPDGKPEGDTIQKELARTESMTCFIVR